MGRGSSPRLRASAGSHEIERRAADHPVQRVAEQGREALACVEDALAVVNIHPFGRG